MRELHYKPTSRQEPASVPGSMTRKHLSERSWESAQPFIAETLNTSGSPLDKATRCFFEPRFGHDLSRVRIYADAKAAQSAHALNADAYTIGKHVVFGKDRYSPETDAGRRLLAHELLHVIENEYTSKGSYRWGVNSSIKMNPRYWQRSNDRWGAKPGVSLEEASRDVFENPSGFNYAMACQLATGVTFVAGSGSAAYKESNTNEDDWVPGDWGYIENKAYKEGQSQPGTEGENIIYIGGRQFWGHPRGNKTFNEWMCHIQKMNNNTGKPELKKWRKYTALGLD